MQWLKNRVEFLAVSWGWRAWVKRKSEVKVTFDSLWPCNSPGQNPGVGSLSVLQGIFPTQGLNSGLPHCRWILYWLNNQGSPRILEWVACPFSRGSSPPRNWTRVSCIAGGFFTSWATREAPPGALACPKNCQSQTTFFFPRENFFVHTSFCFQKKSA